MQTPCSRHWEAHCADNELPGLLSETCYRYLYAGQGLAPPHAGAPSNFMQSEGHAVPLKLVADLLADHFAGEHAAVSGLRTQAYLRTGTCQGTHAPLRSEPAFSVQLLPLLLPSPVPSAPCS